MYYPLDDAIRNKGHLTLISPKYVADFLPLLKSATLSVNKQNIIDNLVIPANEG